MNTHKIQNLKKPTTICGAGEMGEAIKCLSCKHEDLNWTPRIHISKRSRCGSSHLQTLYWGSNSDQPRLVGKLQASEGPDQKQNKQAKYKHTPNKTKCVDNTWETTSTLADTQAQAHTLWLLEEVPFENSSIFWTQMRPLGLEEADLSQSPQSCGLGLEKMQMQSRLPHTQNNRHSRDRVR